MAIETLKQEASRLGWAVLLNSQSVGQSIKREAGFLPPDSEIWITAPDGLVSSEGLPLPKDWGRFQHKLEASDIDLHSRGIEISSPYPDPVTPSELKVTISEPLVAADNGSMGRISVSVPVSSFLDEYASIGLRPGSFVLVLSVKGDLLFHFPFGGKMQGLSSETIAKRFVGRSRGTFPAQNGDILYSYVESKAFPVYIVAGATERAVESEWTTSMSHFLVTGISALILSGVICYLLAKSRRREHDIMMALKASEGSYRNLYERYLALFKKTPVALQSVDSALELQTVSERWQELLGYKVEQAIGRSFLEFIRPESKEEFVLTWKEIRDNPNETHRGVNVDVVCNDGNVIEALISIEIERSEDGGFVQGVMSIIDMTAKNATEEAVRRATKMEALGKLTGGLAHDFSNILAVIRGNAELAKRHADARNLRFLDSILNSSKQALALTNQLVSFSRSQSKITEVIALQDFFPAIASMVAPSIKDQIHITYSIAQDLWRVELDHNDFEVAIMNLIVNAMDAIQRAGDISVCAENAQLTRGELPQAPHLYGQYVRVVVEDDGRGMTKEEAKRAFDPFYTTKENGVGSGLGLSHVYGIVTQAKGVVYIESLLGEGTRLILLLPRSFKPALCRA